MQSLFVIAIIVLFAFTAKTYYGFTFYPWNIMCLYGLILFSILISTAVKDVLHTNVHFTLIYVVLFILIEVLYFCKVVNITDSEERVGSSYKWFDMYLPKYASWAKSADLTEAFFDNDWTLTGEQAMTRKYDYIYEQLGLRPGMVVLDIGSGYCQWMQYLKERGVRSTGFTLSQDQIESCKGRALDAVLQNVMSIPDKYKGKFDAVTIIGSAEHYTNSSMTKQAQSKVFSDIFARLSAVLNDASSCKKVFVSGVCLNNGYEHKDSISYNFHCYLLERHYNGMYLSINQLRDAIEPHFKRLLVRDTSEDYRFISIVETKHFGNFKVAWDSVEKIVYAFYMFATDPYALHKWLYHYCGSWMWQFGGTSKNPRPEMTKTPMRATFEVYEKKAT